MNMGLHGLLKGGRARRNRSSRIRLRQWAPALVLLAGAVAPRLGAQTPRPVIGSSATPVQHQPASHGLQEPVFEFRSGFWVNLHHFLYLQARLQRGLAVAAGAQSNPSASNAASLSALSAAERQTWQKAVDYYAENFADRGLPYDSFLVRIDDRLSDMADCPDLTGRSSRSCAAGIDAALTAILEEAAPVYRAHWWAGQDGANRAWISQTTMLIRQYGAKPAEGLSQAFSNVWPSAQILVDVVPYAGTTGGYITLSPAHMLVASANSYNQGFAALETVFRLASDILAKPVQQAIAEQCHQRTQPVPRDLWHALVAYTTAEVFEQSFAAGSLPGGDSPESISQSERAYISARGWQFYQQLIEQYWQPYLDGQRDMRSAVAAIVDAL